MHNPIRSTAIQKARQLWVAQPVFLDTETTGLGESAEIIEISIVNHDGNVLLDSLVRPRRSIPFDAIQVHGITDEMVRSAPTWMHVWPQVETLLAERSVGIYNAEFDLRMMRQSHQGIGMPWRRFPGDAFCVMRLYSDFFGARKWQRLEDAGRQCRISLPNTHRAKDDTLLTLAVFKHMVESQP
jgi:DNA polymerase III epsilon subunit-like protein